MNTEKERADAGQSLINLLAALALASVLMGIGALNLRAFSVTSRDAASQMAEFLSLVRSLAIESGSPWQVISLSDTTITSQPVESCDGDPLIEGAYNPVSFSLPTSFTMSPAEWSICFSSRGHADGVLQVFVSGSTSETGAARGVRVLLSGLAYAE